MKKLLFLFLMCTPGILIWLPVKAQNSRDFMNEISDVAKVASQNPQKMKAEQKQHLDDLKEKLKSEALSRIQHSRQKNGVSDNTSVSIEDSLALVALYNATDGPNWYNNENWLVGPVESWYGIALYFNTIWEIHLNNNNLSGNIPPEIGSLYDLQIIELDYNQLTGSLPPEIGNLISLWCLCISNNQLSGSIPAEIGNLTYLGLLKLSNNQFTGNLPPEIANLSYLTEFHLSNNQISGEIPVEFGNFANLYYLFLDANQLSGSIPFEICNIYNLSYFAFYNNYFDLGSCPAINCLLDKGVSMDSGVQQNGFDLITDCTPLQVSVSEIYVNSEAGIASFEVYTNNNWNASSNKSWCTVTPEGTGYGTITVNYDENIAVSTRIASITISTNTSQGIVNIIQSGVGNLNSDSLALVALYNSTDGPNWNDNSNWLTGPLNTWYGISVWDNYVGDIALSNNNLVGNLPPEIGDFANLLSLNLSTNQLTGNIPPEIGNLSSLYSLNLSYNQLAGNIPQEIGNLAILQGLYLKVNNLTGIIPPEIGNFSKIVELILSYNMLSGSIPQEIGNLKNVTSIAIDNNQLEGIIPNEICYLPNITNFEYKKNYFDPNSCTVITCLESRGISSQGSQLNGYNLNFDCNDIMVDIVLDEDSICGDGTAYYLGNVTALGFSQISWSTNIGTGYFLNETSLNPSYYPSNEDIIEGVIDLQITVSNDMYVESDNMLLCFSPSPTINVGEDATINKGQLFYSSIVNAKYYNSTIWTTNGDGSFTDDNSLLTIYNPGTLDLENGQVELCLSASPILPCINEVQDCMVLTIIPEVQTISLNQGWSGISSSILPSDQNVEAIFQPVLQELIFLQNETSTFWPDQGVNTIGLWDTHKGYTIKVANTIDLTITGITENEKTVELAYGWNLIPVLNNNSTGIVELFSGSDVEIIKEVAGTKIYWPAMNIQTLDSLMPGKAYYVRMNSPTSLTFPNYLIVSPQNKNVSKLSGELVFDVKSNVSWVVTEDASWLSVVPQGGHKNSNFKIKYDVNTESESRSSEIIVSSTDGLITVPVVVFQEAGPVWLCGQPLNDTRDGKSYPTVEIGSQCWMAANLNIGTRINSNTIQSDNQIIEKYCINNTDCEIYGGLYQWNEMMQYSTNQGAQGICPEGWHIPTDDELTTLFNYLGGVNVAGVKLKETGTTHWDAPNLFATNSSGFTGLPGGYSTGGIPATSGEWGLLWSSTLSNSNRAKGFYLFSGVSRVSFSDWTINEYAISVRCLKHVNTTLSVPGIYTTEVTNRTPSSAVSGGHVFNDGGANVAERGIVWSTSINPTISNNEGITIDGEGLGSFESSMTGLQSSSIYYIRAYATNSEGTAYGNELSFRTFADVIPNCGILIDARDGQEYNTVIIGNQCWMAENLNVGTRIDGSSDQTNNGSIEKYCYDNFQNNCDVYGGLYQWAEIVQYLNGATNNNHWSPYPTGNVQGICPNGWHLPTNEEFCEMEVFVDPSVTCGYFYWYGTDIGGHLKEVGNEHWEIPNTGATNYSGFTALPGGGCSPSGFGGGGFSASFWTASPGWSLNSAFKKGLSTNSSQIVNWDPPKFFGASVRCVKDVALTSQLEVTSPNQIVTSIAGSTTFEVISNTSWLVSENANWFSVDPSGGSNNGTLTVTYEENSSSESRNGQITITATDGTAIVYASVTQTGCELCFSVIPLNQSVTAVEGNTTFEVSSNTYWTVEENVSWLTVEPLSGINNGTLTVTFDANSITVGRIGQITITAAGGTPSVNVTVTQAAFVPVLSVTPSNRSVTADAGTTTFDVSSNTSWTVSENADWLTVTPDNGIQNGNLSVNYDANLTVSTRIGEITVTTAEGSPVVVVTITQQGDQQSWVCGQPITDSRDGQTYNTVQIGTQCWMAENLNIGTRIAGNSNQTNNTTIEKYCYNDSEANCDVYGGLYQWNEMMGYTTTAGVQGICPNGWQVPTDQQWTALTNYVSSQTAFRCNSTTTFIAKALAAKTNWNSATCTCCVGNNLNTNNATNFTALPGGVRSSNGSFYAIGNNGYWWCSTESYVSVAWSLNMYRGNADIIRGNQNKDDGNSVRCIKE